MFLVHLGSQAALLDARCWGRPLKQRNTYHQTLYIDLLQDIGSSRGLMHLQSRFG